MRVSSHGTPSIGRRRGAARRGKDMVLNQKSLLILFAISATIFSLGLIIGTRAFGSPSDSPTADHASPLVAATSKVASADIQKLILESAAAEKIERELREQEREALQHGDTKLAAHLRGGLAPGDANYNPHRAVDDVVEEEVGGGGDGGMYASDQQQGELSDSNNSISNSNDGKHDENAEDMHNHFADAIKSELSAVKHKEEQFQKKVVESMHNQFSAALRNEQKVVSKIKQGVNNIKQKVGLRGAPKDDAGEGSKGEGEGGNPYPYMTSPVSETHDFTAYEPLGGGRFSEYVSGEAPYEITEHLTRQSDELARSRRHHVRKAMEHVWTNYKKYAFGMDELHPISHKATSNWGGMGVTLVDSLDTLWLMGMKAEFAEARDWVRDHLVHSNPGSVSGFETTIRSLGGLLAAYDLSGEQVFLTRADDLAGKLVKAYDTESGLPHGSINLQSGHSSNFNWNSGMYILAEIGTQQVEYRYLARAVNKPEYAAKSMKVFDILHDIQPSDGLMFQNLRDAGPGKASFSGQKVSFGAMSDSVYEYLLKVWVQGGRTEARYRQMWDKAMAGLHDQLLQKSSPSGLAYIADRNGERIDHKMDHLVCFMGGALALSAYTDPLGRDSARARRDLKTARALTYTCYQMYARQKTGIAPEFVDFPSGQDMTLGSAPFYILRPETVESLYYLSVLTGDPIYREWGWEIFQSIERYCKTQYGYGGLRDVNNPSSVDDRMESFFLAETLKYLYLLFDPDSEIDVLNKHVFNTEAHPLKIFTAKP